MTTVKLKPFAQNLVEHLQTRFGGHRSMQRAAEGIVYPPSIEQESQELIMDAEATFLASIAHLSEIERAEHIQRHEWYAALAARQAIGEVEWRQQRYQQTGNPLYRL